MKLNIKKDYVRVPNKIEFNKLYENPRLLLISQGIFAVNSNTCIFSTNFDFVPAITLTTVPSINPINYLHYSLKSAKPLRMYLKFKMCYF